MSIGSCEMVVGIDPAVSRLVRRTAHALYSAELDEALDAVEHRVLLNKRMLEVAVEDGRVTARLAPYAELALREAIAIARSQLDSATKTSRTCSMLTLAGF